MYSKHVVSVIFSLITGIKVIASVYISIHFSIKDGTLINSTDADYLYSRRHIVVISIISSHDTPNIYAKYAWL